MDYAFILDFSYTDKQLSVLKTYGLFESEALSWKPERRKKAGIKELFHEASVIETKSYKIKDITIDVTANFKPPEQFQLFAKEFSKLAINEIQSKIKDNDNIILIAYNFFPFIVTKTLVDKICMGLYLTYKDIPKFTKIAHLFMSRNINTFANSKDFDFLVKNCLNSTNVFVIDNTPDSVSYINGVKQIEHSYSESALKEALEFKKGSFYNSLVYGTNSYIGHFDLTNSHVRTHYDLYEFVCRDDVSEHLENKIKNLFGEAEHIVMFGIGLETASVERLGYQVVNRVGKERVSYEPLFGRHPEIDKLKDVIKDSDCIIVLTDIVNSGSTIVNTVKVLREINKKNVPIKSFSIVKMQNTDQNLPSGFKIDSAEIIRRDYYLPDPEKCLLCKLDQPIWKVDNIEQFAHIDKDQLTPLDFWEIVEDSQALEEYGKDIQERTFFYRIETKPIFQKYKRWLKNIVEHKYKQCWPSLKPQFICTVKEETGLLFSMIVAESIGMDFESIFSVNRSKLSRITPSSTPVKDLGFNRNWSRALIVDDGINHGNTLQTLIELCRSMDVTIMGALVFDCRLSERKIKEFQHQMNGGKLISLYNWRAPIGGTL